MANKENNINLKLKKKYNMEKFKNFVTSFHKLSKSNYLVSVINAKVTYKKIILSYKILKTHRYF